MTPYLAQAVARKDPEPISRLAGITGSVPGSPPRERSMRSSGPCRGRPLPEAPPGSRTSRLALLEELAETGRIDEAARALR